MLTRGVTVLHDNTHSHVAHTVKDMHSMQWKVLNHHPILPAPITLSLPCVQPPQESSKGL
jgi:hypothetical protein